MTEELVSLARRLCIKRELAQALSLLGQRLISISKPEDALPCLKEAAILFSEAGEAEDEIKALTSIVSLYAGSAEEPAPSLEALEEICAIYKQLNDPAKKIEAMTEMARQLRRQGANTDIALRCYEAALEVSVATGDTAKQGDILNSMGIVEWERGRYTQALEHYQSALAVFRAKGDISHEGLMLNSIGITLQKLNRNEEALECLKEAVEVHRQSGQRLLEGHALAAEAQTFAALGRTSESAACSRASLDIRREVGDRKGEAWMLYHLAAINLSGGSPNDGAAPVAQTVSLRPGWPRAQSLLEQSRSIAAEVGDERLIAAIERLTAEAQKPADTGTGNDGGPLIHQPAVDKD